jgi:hypothetical protein
MAYDGVAERIDQNQTWKKQILGRHRPAFNAWLRLARLLEEAVVKGRKLDTAFDRALDIFFVEAFKSHQSLYSLCVLGHVEDAATIARRLFEIALQVDYLCSEETERGERGARFLAHFWHNARDILSAIGLPQELRKWWERQYQRHKEWLSFQKNGQPATHWFGSNFAHLAGKLGLKETYDKDYRLLSHIAHCSARGLLLDRTNEMIQIKTDRFVREILIYGTKYALWVTANWNEHFQLINVIALEALRDEVLNFDLKTKP